jgi:hypothetical protein
MLMSAAHHKGVKRCTPSPSQSCGRSATLETGPTARRRASSCGPAVIRLVGAILAVMHNEWQPPTPATCPKDPWRRSTQPAILNPSPQSQPATRHQESLESPPHSGAQSRWLHGVPLLGLQRDPRLPTRQEHLFPLAEVNCANKRLADNPGVSQIPLDPALEGHRASRH